MTSSRSTTATAILYSRRRRSSTQCAMRLETFRFQGPQRASCTLPQQWVHLLERITCEWSYHEVPRTWRNGKIKSIPKCFSDLCCLWHLLTSDMQGFVQNSRHSSHRRSAHSSTREEHPVNPVVSVWLLNAITPPSIWSSPFSAVCEVLDFYVFNSCFQAQLGCL